MGLYFSGSESLQSLVAPTVEGLEPFSWREFGLLYFAELRHRLKRW